MIADSQLRLTRRLAAPAFFGLYVAALAVASHGSPWAALPLLAMGWLAWRSNAETGAKRQDRWLVLAMCIFPIGLAVVKHQEMDAHRRFAGYLKAHGCHYDGTEPRFAPAAAGGRYREDAEPFEYDEPVYACSATGRRITFRDFEAGGFGE